MDSAREILQNFIIDYCEYLPPEIPRLTEPPTAIEFLTNYVHPNLPVIIKPEGGFFPEAVDLWRKTYEIRELMMRKSITVAATPDGKADSIVDDKFMIPEERTMVFSDYMVHYEDPSEMIEIKESPLYVQKQNNNLIEEFSPLLPFLSEDVPWATEALGKPPEATNFWMGDHRSFTSMHKDHYENIYFVITGSKTFRIFPPISIAWMPYRKCPKFQWYYDKVACKWGKKDMKEEVTWIRTDLQPDTRQKWKMMLMTKSYTVSIHPGEALYIPSMWFHEVSQIDQTIAVNYWYDMSYEVKYPLFCLVDALAKLPVSRKDASNDIQIELEKGLYEDILPRIIPKKLPKNLEK